MTFPNTDAAELERAKRILAESLTHTFTTIEQATGTTFPENAVASSTESITAEPAKKKAAAPRKSRAKAKTATAVTFAEPPAVENDQLEKLVNSGVENIDTLLAEARSRLSLATPVDNKTDKRIAPGDIVNPLLAKAAELKRTEDSAKKERAKITDLLAEIAGPIAGTKSIEMVVDNATVFTVSQVESRGIDLDYVKSAHPDIPANAAYWKTSISVRRNYK